MADKVSRGDGVQLAARKADNTWLQVIGPKGTKAWAPASAVELTQGVVDALPSITNLPKPPALILGWTGEPVQTVCIVSSDVFTSDYTRYNPGATPVPLDGDIDPILTGLGLKIVPPDSQCDATLTIKMTIQPKGHTYNGSNGSSFFCYSGAQIDGTMDLVAPDGTAKYSGGFDMGPPYQIAGCTPGYPYARLKVIGAGVQKIWCDPLDLLAPCNRITVFPSKGMNLYGDAAGTQVLATIEPNSYFYCWKTGQEGSHWKVSLQVSPPLISDSGKVRPNYNPNDYLTSDKNNQKIEGRSGTFARAQAVIPILNAVPPRIEGYFDSPCGQ